MLLKAVRNTHVGKSPVEIKSMVCKKFQLAKALKGFDSFSVRIVVADYNPLKEEYVYHYAESDAIAIDRSKEYPADITSKIPTYPVVRVCEKFTPKIHLDNHHVLTLTYARNISAEVSPSFEFITGTEVFQTRYVNNTDAVDAFINARIQVYTAYAYSTLALYNQNETKRETSKYYGDVLQFKMLEITERGYEEHSTMCANIHDIPDVLSYIEREVSEVSHYHSHDLSSNMEVRTDQSRVLVPLIYIHEGVSRDKIQEVIDKTLNQFYDSHQSDQRCNVPPILNWRFDVVGTCPKVVPYRSAVDFYKEAIGNVLATAFDSYIITQSYAKLEAMK